MKKNEKKEYQNPKININFYVADVICSSDPYMHDIFDEDDFSSVL